MSIKIINKLFYWSWVYLAVYLVYHFGFMNGYDDAKNDFKKQGYNFTNVRRAFQ